MKKKIGEKQTRLNEQAVWEVFPKATYFGVDDKSKFPIPSNCVCQVYESDAFDAKVIGDGDTYNEAWADAASKLPKGKKK